MNLKTLITLKFVISIAGACMLLYIITGVTDMYNSLEEQNTILSHQKEMYHHMAVLGPDKVKEKQGLQSAINHFESKLEKQKKSGLEVNIWLFMLVGTYFVYTRVLDYLNKRVQKVKLATGDTGEML